MPNLPKLQKNETPDLFDERGFTLMETITVLVLMAALAIVIVPNMFSSYQSFIRSSALNQVGRDLRYAQEYAISRRDTVWIAFNVGGNSYAVYGGDSTAVKTLLKSHTEGDWVVQMGQREYKYLTLVDADFDGGSELVFDNFGNPILTSDGLLEFGDGSTITVQAETGKVSIP
ncbi:MAG: type II secretion system GspH family protein [Lentisphaeria bacterium]|nr:type II secretion system GspH family protein [Candidatus Neomarinimicrobiota bacterium]MCF7842504.1 type II secretion system GspH family protein [Lentisphaeria bacterium]